MLTTKSTKSKNKIKIFCLLTLRGAKESKPKVSTVSPTSKKNSKGDGAQLQKENPRRNEREIKLQLKMYKSESKNP